MVKRTDDGLVILVKLTPKAAREAIGPWVRDSQGQPVLKAAVTAVPERGKANAALIAMIAKTWGLPKSSVIILRGDTDRNKMLLLKGISELPAKAPQPAGI